ncbi:MAG: DUF3276 family protein [Lentimicrobiaceae bacterium]|nr:DUF3276 family protein [Lentimicrobiaceae bacterium]
MDELEPIGTRDDVFSRIVKAGKRTYFFDVKSTRNGQLYITITESVKRFDEEQGKYTYRKHKLFLYKEDFEKFSHGLEDVLSFIETGVEPPEREYPPYNSFDNTDEQNDE